MANELLVTYDASATLYAVIRRASDQYAWDSTNSTFEAWDDASIGDYDLPLTSQGGDVYAADFPASIGSGEYVIAYYLQLGASPAVTDPSLGSEGGYWDGSAVSDSPSSDNYVSLARVKRYLGIDSAVTAYDALLNDLIPAACKLVDNYCDVDPGGFASAVRTEYHNGGRDWVTLRSLPVTVGPKVRYATDAMEVTNSDTTNNQEAYVSVRDTGMDLVRYNTSGTAVTVTIAWTAADTLTALAALVNAQGNGWAASVVADYANWNPSLIRESQGRRDAYAGNTVTLEVFASGPGVTRCDPTLGTVYLDCPAPRGMQNVRVDYSGGYGTIPDDLAAAACSLAAALYRRASRDVSLKKERIGDYSYELGDAALLGTVEDLSPDAARLLQRYRRVRCL